jgi:pilus assembly protein CpaC
MQVGDQVTLPAQGVKSYSEGIAGVVEVRVPRDGGEFVLVALRPGSTTLLFFLFDGREREVRVHVHAPEQPAEDPLAVAPADNVRLDLYFVQVSESTGHDLGIAYPESIGGSARLTASFDVAQAALSEASIGIADQILPRLDLAQRTGRARIASKASVVSVNGKQALYNSGGEINVRVQGALTAEVRPIRYGSQLQMAPRFDPGARRVELTINAEIAALSDDGGTGVPGRQVSTLNTVVNLDLGKSLVLAGLSSESDAHSARGLPWLSRIPVLGALFGSQGFRSERVRNYLVIVPCVVQAVASEERRVVDELLHAYQEFDGDVRSLSLDPKSLGDTRSPTGVGGAR